MKKFFRLMTIFSFLVIGSSGHLQAFSLDGKLVERVLCGLVKSGTGNKILAAGQSGLIGGAAGGIILTALQPRLAEKFGIKLRDKGFIMKMLALGIFALKSAAVCGGAGLLGSTLYHISDKAGTPLTIAGLILVGAGAVLGLSLDDTNK